ncbi:S1 RNA-binding domain-containing protein [Thermodesulfobacteriota bacterium]
MGDLVQGTITSVRDFGAFVDIGGIEGLIPISEIGWGRVEDIHADFYPGQEVEVSILKLDWEAERFSFSLRETLEDPWDTVSSKYSPGVKVVGTVVRLAPFGAFVSLESGIDGLLHVSKIGQGKKINHPREVLEEAQSIEVILDSIDSDNRRISLSLVGAGVEQSEGQKEEDYRKYVATAKQDQRGSMGTLGDLLKSSLNGKIKNP